MQPALYVDVQKPQNFLQATDPRGSSHREVTFFDSSSSCSQVTPSRTRSSQQKPHVLGQSRLAYVSVQKCGIEVHKLSSNLSSQLPSAKEVVEKCVVTWLVVLVVLGTVVVAVACVLGMQCPHMWGHMRDDRWELWHKSRAQTLPSGRLQSP